MTASPPSHRRSQRVPVQLEATLRARSARAVTVVDLSRTGCLVRCPARLGQGSIHDLALQLGGAPFAVKARVSAASLDGAAGPGDPRPYLVGLEFLPLPARAELALRTFLAGAQRVRAAP